MNKSNSHVFKKVLLVVLSLSVFFSLLAVSSSATIVNINVTDYNKPPFGYTISGELIDSADDSHLSDYYSYNDFIFTDDNLFLYDSVFYGSAEVDDVGNNDFYYQLYYSEDFYLINPTVTFDTFYFTDSDDAFQIINEFWYDVTILFGADFDVYSTAKIGFHLDLYDVENGYRALDGFVPLNTPSLVDDLGHIYFANMFTSLLIDIGYFEDDYPVYANISFTLNDAQIEFGDTICLFHIPDDITCGYLDEYTYALNNYGSNKGYIVGYNQGYDEGSSLGYNDGYNAGQSSSITADGIGGMLSDAVGGFLDADIIGSISIGDILLCICGIALVLIFLKFFAGG